MRGELLLRLYSCSHLPAECHCERMVYENGVGGPLLIFL